MRRTLLFILSLGLLTCSYAQLKVTNNGNVGVGTNNPTTKLQINGEGFVHSNIGQWGRAFWVKVNQKNACSYHLWSAPKGRDVFYVCEAGYLYSYRGGYFGSDINLKENIQPIESPLQRLMLLNGVRYQFKEDKEEYRLGLIAQDVEQVFPEVVKTMPDSVKAIAYTDLIAVTIEAIKEQQQQIILLQEVIAMQEKDIISLKEIAKSCCGIELNRLQDSIYNIDSITTKSSATSDEIIDAILYDNIPNPFNTNTEIKFKTPLTFSTAKLVIYNLQGLEIQDYNITQGGNGSVTIQGSQLAAGMYLYSLFVDNTLIDTKRMVLTK